MERRDAVLLWLRYDFEGPVYASSNRLTLSGLANFLFGIPAVGTIDTFGRRKWLLVTIPGMALALAAAAASLEHPDELTRRTLALVFMLGMSAFKAIERGISSGLS